MIYSVNFDVNKVYNKSLDSTSVHAQLLFGNISFYTTSLRISSFLNVRIQCNEDVIYFSQSKLCNIFLTK